MMLQRQFAGVLGGEGGMLQSLFGAGADATGPAALGAAATAATAPITALGTAAATAATALQVIPFGGAGGSGLLGSFFGGASPIASAFSGGGIGSVFSAAAPSLLGSFFPGASALPLNFLAKGGPAKANKPYFVGENPDGSINETTELFIPGVSGTVIPADETQEAVAAAMGIMSDDPAGDDEAGEASGGTRDAVAKAMGTMGRGTDSRTSSSNTAIDSKTSSSNSAIAVMRELAKANSATTNAVSNMISAEVERERQAATSTFMREAGNTNVNYNGPVLRFNDEDYVRKSDVSKIVNQGARRGRELVAKGMKNDPGFRRGMR